MTIYFRPTWLYIKQHNVTGLKYFGMTRSNVEKYHGSGKYWKLHLQKYGKNITTTWCQLFENESDIINYAIEFSIKNNIVDSDEWANLVPESGEYGKSAGLKGWKHSDAAKQKISNARTGKPATKGMTGQSHSQYSKDKCSKTLIGRARPQSAIICKAWKISYLLTNTSEIITNLKKWCELTNLNYQLVHRNAKLNKPYKGIFVQNTSDLPPPSLLKLI